MRFKDKRRHERARCAWHSRPAPLRARVSKIREALRVAKRRSQFSKAGTTPNRALAQALTEGYVGLCATGDITWQMGPQAGFATLFEYEWRLEEFFRKHPQLCGICQYHGDTLPSEILRQDLLTHPLLFVNETLSRINPHFVRPEAFTES